MTIAMAPRKATLANQIPAIHARRCHKGGSGGGTNIIVVLSLRYLSESFVVLPLR